MKNSPDNEGAQKKTGGMLPYISLPLARERVTRWLKTVAPLFEKDPDSIPRAIFISHEDLAQLRHDYPDTKGIRVYFGLHEDSIEITGLVVPVIEHEGANKDVLEKADREEETLIYDFTSPCPIYCDKASELYVKLDGPGS